MPTKRYRPEEIVSKLRQVDVLSRFAQLAPRMLSGPARFRRGMPNTPSVGWATQACLAARNGADHPPISSTRMGDPSSPHGVFVRCLCLEGAEQSGQARRSARII